MSAGCLTTADPRSVRPLRVLHAVFSLQTGGLENGVVNLCNRLDRERLCRRPSARLWEAALWKPTSTRVAWRRSTSSGVGTTTRRCRSGWLGNCNGGRSTSSIPTRGGRWSRGC